MKNVKLSAVMHATYLPYAPSIVHPFSPSSSTLFFFVFYAPDLF